MFTNKHQHCLKRLAWLLVSWMLAQPVGAIVPRHDVDADQYSIETAPNYLIDMPHEGHAVLIHPQWLITVAHTIFYNYEGKALQIDGVEYTIETVVKHPNFKQSPANKANRTNENLWEFLLDRADIALLRLDHPVGNGKPISIYRDIKERGMTVEILGRGATGNGITGADINTKTEGVLRRCYNIIETANKQWLSYQFDKGESALSLEGMHGSGDSGGPLTTTIDNTEYLIGLSSWELHENSDDNYVAGLYGTTAYATRISYFADWIDETIMMWR